MAWRPGERRKMAPPGRRKKKKKKKINHREISKTLGNLTTKKKEKIKKRDKRRRIWEGEGRKANGRRWKKEGREEEEEVKYVYMISYIICSGTLNHLITIHSMCGLLLCPHNNYVMHSCHSKMKKKKALSFGEENGFPQ